MPASPAVPPPPSVPPTQTGISNLAAAVAVFVALAVGVLASLALRPPSVRVGEGSEAVQAESVRWRLPIAFATNLPALGDNPVYVAKQVAAASGGRLELEIFEPGEMVPTFSIVDAVRDGKVESGYTWLGYDQGKIPSSVLFGAVPFGMEPWEYMAWWYEGGGRELAEDLYLDLGVQPILCGLIGPETAGWFREEITSVEDFRGLKIRFAGLGGMVLQELEASVTLIPGGEIFQALEKGAIDATEFSLPVVDERLGFDRVAHFNYFPGWHQPFTAAHLVVHLPAWKALDDAGRAVVETACTAGVTRNLARAEALQGPVLAGYAERGVEAKMLSEPILRELQRVSVRVLEAEARKSDRFRRIWDSQRAFSDDYRRWKGLGYLPRDF